MAELKYAIYPGTVQTYNEDGDPTGPVTWTATDLATAYGLAPGDYITVSTPSQVPHGLNYFNYIHLKPRADNKYQNYKYVAEDDGQTIAYRPNFDGSKRFIQESSKTYVEPDIIEDREADNY